MLYDGQYLEGTSLQPPDSPGYFNLYEIIEPLKWNVCLFEYVLLDELLNVGRCVLHLATINDVTN